MTNGILIGYKRFTGKNGKDYCVATVVSDCSARDSEYGMVGQKAEEIFLPASQLNYLQVSDIGKAVSCDYEFSGNRAYLTNFSVSRK